MCCDQKEYFGVLLALLPIETPFFFYKMDKKFEINKSLDIENDFMSPFFFYFYKMEKKLK